MAQQSLESNYRMTGQGLLAAFEPQREIIQKSSAVIYEGRAEVAYAVVISTDGYLLTKASVVEGKTDLSVRIDRSVFSDPKIVMIDPRWDLALLKIKAEHLKPLAIRQGADPEVGTWLVVNGATTRSRRRILAGIVSANSRPIPGSGGAILGVGLREGNLGLEITSVAAGSGAETADIRIGDRILKIGDLEILRIEELTTQLEGKKVGTFVDLSILRNEEKIDAIVQLLPRRQLYPIQDRNDQMSGDFSLRRSGFPRVIQHDIVGNRHTMGGPVIDLSGQLVGMNIARANRAETYAIPANELRELADGMLRQVRP